MGGGRRETGSVWTDMLTEINYEYDKKMLLREAEEREGYEPFVDPKTGTVIKEWLIKRDVTGYGKMICDEFMRVLNVPIKPRFYIQEKGFTVPFIRIVARSVVSTLCYPLQEILSCFDIVIILLSFSMRKR